MKPWIVARSTDLVDPGERAFVEYIDAATPDRLTYSSLLSEADCSATDRRAYSDARTWYLEGEADPTIENGVSLGTAFEYHATLGFIRHHRAELLLRRLLAEGEASEIRLRGVGEEWSVAARSLGIRAIVERPDVVPKLMPGAHAPAPTRSQRAMGWLAGVRGADDPRLVFVEGPRWALPYHQALVGLASTRLVDPGRRMLMEVLRTGTRVSVGWLSDLEFGSRAAPSAALTPDTSLPAGDARMAVETGFRRIRLALKAWAAAGHGASSRGGVAIATQDVLPPSRAYLLGMKAAGGRVVTLEHGISGVFVEQVRSIAEVLAAWGEPQAEYHRTAGPHGLLVVPVGSPRLEAAVAGASDGEPAWDVIFFGQPTADLAAGDWPETHLRAFRFVEEYAAAHPNRRVAVKLHPATRAYGFALPPIRHAELVTGESIGLILASRAVALVHSTTGLEAMALGRPVVQISPVGYLGPAEFLSLSGATAVVDSSARFTDEVERLLSKPADYESARVRGRDFARSFVKGLEEPGSAVRRLTETVLDMM